MSSGGAGPAGPQEAPRWNGLKRTAFKRRKRELRRFGKKARRDADALREVKPQLLARSGGHCEAMFSPQCTRVGVDPHHVNRNRSDNRLANLLWACRFCHDAIHANPASARAAGLLESAAR